MAQGAGASDPEPRALRGAATAPRVTSGPRGRAQAEADRARTPPGRPLQLSARSAKAVRVWGTEAPVARGRRRLALLPRTGVAPGRALAGRALCPARTEGSVPARRGLRPRLSAEGTFGNTALQPPPVPSAFGHLSTSGRLRTVCPNSVYGGTLLERVSAFDGCGGRRAACEPPSPPPPRDPSSSSSGPSSAPSCQTSAAFPARLCDAAESSTRVEITPCLSSRLACTTERCPPRSARAAAGQSGPRG